MIFKKIIQFVVFVSFIYTGNSQITCTLQDSISFASKNYKTYKGKDIYDNLFFLQEGTLIKTDQNTTWEYANFELGVPTSVSLLNPLQILVFYKDTNTFVLLDKFLSEIKRVDLNTISPSRGAKWVNNTKNKEVWLYNSLNNELEFFNYKNNTKLTENTIINGDPIDLASGFNTAYLLFEDKIKGYNNYGTVIAEIPIDDVDKISLNNNKLMVNHKDELEFFDARLNSLGRLKKPKNSEEGVFLSDEKLYIYHKSILYTYQLTISSK